MSIPVEVRAAVDVVGAAVDKVVVVGFGVVIGILLGVCVVVATRMGILEL